MVGCQCDNITKLGKKKNKKKQKKKPWSHSIEKETLLGDALIPSSTALALLGFASSSYMQRSQFQNHFLICTSCSCERAFVKNDEQVLAGTPRVLICCKCSWLSVPADSGRRNAAGLDVDPFLAAHSRQSMLCLIYFSSELVCACVYSPFVSSFDLFCLRFKLVMVMHMTWETCTSSTTQAGGFDCSLDQIRHFFQVLHEFLEPMMSC
jgi:hypothetical protein